MKQANFLKACVLSAFLFAAGTLHAAKPNFVIIFTDDQGYGDLSCFGSKTIKPPSLDRIAKEGRKFTSFMVARRRCARRRARRY